MNETIAFDKTRYSNQIEQYRQVQSAYENIATVLVKVLDDLSRSLGLSLIIQTRAKSIASFAEKIQRPDKHYQNPIGEITDLCGARIIASSLADVAAVNRLITDHFDIVEEKSMNKQDELNADQFGYLSSHYVVRFEADNDAWQEIHDFISNQTVTAEIQVRTVLQHAWADIAHQLSYKNRFQLPVHWTRTLAQLASDLEKVDEGFDRIKTEVQKYTGYETYLDEATLHTEIDKIRVTLKADPDNPVIAHRLAKMLIHLGHWDPAIAILQKFEHREIPLLLRELGVSLCKRHAKEPESDAFQTGQSCLARAAEKNPLDVDTWASLAGSWRTRENAIGHEAKRIDYRNQARQFYKKAYEVDPGDPYALGNFIEYELAELSQQTNTNVTAYFNTALQTATNRCQVQADVGINLPWAYFDLGKFNLLLNNPIAALMDYTKGIASSTAAYFLDSALKNFTTLAPARDQLAGFDWPRHLLEIARARRFSQKYTPALKPTGEAFDERPVVIVAGYCNHPANDPHRTLLIEGFNEFNGTVISGGTRAGISALVGELQKAYPQKIESVGYIPQRFSRTVPLDRNYSRHRRSPGVHFSPLDPLQYWTDLQASRVETQQIKLLAFGGGDITNLEVCMALALGIPVGIVAGFEGEPAKRLSDPLWSSNELLIETPDNPEAIRHFLKF